jgi:hypothetical protein
MSLCLLIFAILIIFVFLIQQKNENYDNKAIKQNNLEKTSFKNFKETLDIYKRKKYILLFTSGPTLNEFKKGDIPQHVWDDCYIICLKNSINYIDKLNIKPDFLVTNFIGAAETLDEKLIDKHKPLFIGLNYGKIERLEDKIDFMVNLNLKNNYMENVKNNINDINFKNKDNKIYTGWGHIIMELAIPLCLELKPENIITIGWDVKNSKKYWNKETFSNYWQDENNIINDFSVYLHNFLKKHHYINIYKLNSKSGVKIPLVDFNKL